jgi:hypothetical protein
LFSRRAFVVSAGPPPTLPSSCTPVASVGPPRPLQLSRAPIARAWPRGGIESMWDVQFSGNTV